MTLNNPTGPVDVEVEDRKDNIQTVVDQIDSVGGIVCGTRTFEIKQSDGASTDWVSVVYSTAYDYTLTVAPRNILLVGVNNFKLVIKSVEYPVADYPTVATLNRPFTVTVKECKLLAVGGLVHTPTTGLIEYLIPTNLGATPAASTHLITDWTQNSIVPTEFCLFVETLSYTRGGSPFDFATVSWLSESGRTISALPTDFAIPSDTMTIVVKTTLDDTLATNANNYSITAIVRREDCNAKTINDIPELP